MKLKLGVIIPTRGDRPEFFKHCLYLLNRQTLAPDVVEIVNFKPRNSAPDISFRYKTGFENLKTKVDVIAAFEDDDFYHEKYLQTMVEAFRNANTNLLGLDRHVVYHLPARKYGVLHHNTKSAMSNTLIRSSAPIRWPADDHVLIDLFLWSQLGGLTIHVDEPLHLSIKHGTGLTATAPHSPSWQHYRHPDPELKYLKSVVDKKSLEFYSTMK